jgi:HEPN domain-containing protein
MAERSRDRIRQARRDLEAARAQTEAGFHEWACFAAQQAAEKAAQAVNDRLGAERALRDPGEVVRFCEGLLAG